MKIYWAAALLFLSACRSGEPPLVKHELYLPEAVQGQGYYAEVKLPFSHLDKRWTVPLNSGFALSSLNSGGGTRIALSHSGAQPYHELEERLTLNGSTGGGGLYARHQAELYVKVHRADDPELQYCASLRPKPDVLMYDCGRQNPRYEQAERGGWQCKTPQQCSLTIERP